MSLQVVRPIVRFRVNLTQHQGDLMSDTLRDALEKLADSWERRPVKEAHSYPEASAYVDGQYDTYERSADVLRDLLAAHPAEPVGVSDEAVTKALDGWCSVPTYGTYQGQFDAMRAALEAAAPLLGTRPQPSYDAVRDEVQWNKAAWVHGFVQSRIDRREGEATAREIDNWQHIAEGRWNEMYPNLAALAKGASNGV